MPTDRTPLAEPVIVQVGEEVDRIRQWASCGEHRVVLGRGDAALALARQLIAAGYDPARRYEVWRGNMRCLTYRSLGVAAGLTVEERDDGKAPPRFVRYRASPYGGDAKDARNEVEATDGASSPGAGHSSGDRA